METLKRIWLGLWIRVELLSRMVVEWFRNLWRS